MTSMPEEPTRAHRAILELLYEGAWITVGDVNAKPSAELQGTVKQPPPITNDDFEDLRDRALVEEVEDPDLEVGGRIRYILSRTGRDLLEQFPAEDSGADV